MNRCWRILEIPWPPDVPACARAFAADSELAWLDTAQHPAGGDSHSIVGVDPVAVLEQGPDRRAELRGCQGVLDSDDNGWRLWRRTIDRHGLWPACDAGISPGWVGYIGFEMARQIERLGAMRVDDVGLPWLRLAFFDAAVVLDHARQRAMVVVADGHPWGAGAAGGADARVRELAARWSAATLADSSAQYRQTSVDSVNSRLDSAITHGSPSVVWEMPRAAHERIVAEALEYIAAGDIYQVNLAQRIRMQGLCDAFSEYASMRSRNPAAYAALLRWCGESPHAQAPAVESQRAIASVSPELFLQLRGREVLTRPIKGTRPRSGEREKDAAARAELLASEKDAAELAMIIDLHRNDLGRVCEFGSVRVAQARLVEDHPTVVHTVAEVVGRLAAGRDALDLLMACFPAGSISGVPKIRAMQIIDRLEPAARGAYSGAIGVLGLDGSLSLNVAIRTLQIRGTTGFLHVGGGIVADSDPAAEYEETLAKGRGIIEALTRRVQDRVIRRPQFVSP